MTVENQTNKTRQSGDGITDTFSFVFKIFEASNLQVYKIDTSVDPEVSTLLTLITDYTVTISTTTEGGSVTFVVPPTSDEDVFIKRVLEFKQETDIGVNINFPETATENEFDVSRMLDIQMNERASRTLLINQFYNGSTDFELPVPEASTVIGYSSDGLSMVNYTATDLNTVLATTFGKELVQSNDAAEARTLLVAQEDVVTTRGDLVIGDASGDADRLAVGTTNQIVVSDGTDPAWGFAILDEDDMASNSATNLATQQSIKAYADNYSGFRTVMTGNQTVAASTTTVVEFNTEQYDLNSEFDISTYRFTPTVNGIYAVAASVRLDSVADLKFFSLEIFSEGTSVAREQVTSANGGANLALSASTILEMNGTTNYFEVKVFHNDTVPRDLNFTYCKFSAQLLLKL